MKRAIIGFCVLLVMASPTIADIGIIEFDKKTKELFLNQSFSIVNRKEKIPINYYSAPKIANPGQAFEMTDVITDPSLPFIRLIFAGYSSKYFFIYYEQGGRGYNCKLKYYEITKGKKKLIGELVTWKKLKDIEAIKDYLRKQE
jgi:hypothetical protein